MSSLLESGVNSLQILRHGVSKLNKHRGGSPDRGFSVKLTALHPKSVLIRDSNSIFWSRHIHCFSYS